MKEQYFSQPSVMSAQQRFSQVPAADIPRSKFDRSHAYKTTFDAGYLVPVFVDEVLPGDTFHMNATAFARLATPLKPFMDNMFLDVHFFFVPSRLVWDNWEKFMGERPTPDFDPNTLSLPQVEIQLSPDDLPVSSSAAPRLSHYFGLPVCGSADVSRPIPTLSVNALPFRAYHLIYDQWYRDQNLQDSVLPTLYPNGFDDGPDTLDVMDDFPLRRGKRHDYFTSALPWPQKGDQVVIPLGDSAPVSISADGQFRLENEGYDNSFGVGLDSGVGNVPTGPWIPVDKGGNDAEQSGHWRYQSGLQAEADLSTATAVSINDFRMAVTIQRLLERDARGGTRYIELILSHFGVRSDDARLQRAEFLGGGTSAINLSPVASTAVTSVPQANLAAVGTTLNRNISFTKSFTEHGYVIGIASARADLTYQRGIERMWSRQTRYDFYWPTFANLGEQAILNKEIFFSGLPVDDEVFGYQERFAEYRYKPSRVTGLFSSYVDTSLDVWHLAQDFGTDLPVLNSDFIVENPPVDRVIAVPSEPHFLMDMWFDLKCDRPMPVYSVPGLDHL